MHCPGPTRTTRFPAPPNSENSGALPLLSRATHFCTHPAHMHYIIEKIPKRVLSPPHTLHDTVCRKAVYLQYVGISRRGATGRWHVEYVNILPLPRSMKERVREVVNSLSGTATSSWSSAVSTAMCVSAAATYSYRARPRTSIRTSTRGEFLSINEKSQTSVKTIIPSIGVRRATPTTLPVHRECAGDLGFAMAALSGRQ